MNILLANLHKFIGYSGGIEHVLSDMALAFTVRGHKVTVVMMDEKDGTPFSRFLTMWSFIISVIFLEKRRWPSAGD